MVQTNHVCFGQEDVWHHVKREDGGTIAAAAHMEM